MKIMLRIAVALTLGALIVWYAGGVRELASTAAHPHLGYLALAFLVVSADRALMAFKWGLLLKSRGLVLPFFFTLKVYCASNIWGTFLPSTTGADAIRVVLVRREKLDTGELIASVVVERALGFLASLVMGLAAVLILRQHHAWDDRFNPALYGGALFLAAAAGAFVLSLNQSTFDRVWDWMPRWTAASRLGEKINRLHRTYVGYGADRRTLWVFMGLTLAEQAAPILYAWLLALALGAQVGLLFVAGVLPLTLLITRLPISVDGIGVFEGVFVLLMGMAGVPAAMAVSIALIGRVIQILSYLPWWAAYTIETKHIKPPKVGTGHAPE